MTCHVDQVFILIVVDVSYALCAATDIAALTTQSSNITVQENGLFNFEFIATLGGAGLSLFCVVLLMAILCILANVRKRLKRLERRFRKSKIGTNQQKPLTQQTSNQSNVPTDIDKIPKVPRRSEYIRIQRMGNVAKEFKNRVSKIFDFGTPRSSTDTFDLSEQEDPMYDDIAQYRQNEQTHDNNKYWCCCCCGRTSVDYIPTRTSDQQTPRDEPTGMPIPNEGVATLPKPVKNGCKKNKKQEVNNKITVKHVDFDEGKNRIQPTTSNDIIIGVPQTPHKQINTETDLRSFKEKSVVGQKPDQTPNQDKNKEFRSVALHAISGKKKIIGIKLPQAKSMPSLTEEVTTYMSASTSEAMEEKERDPSYIDMSVTLKTPK